jgi:hypothetical protein
MRVPGAARLEFRPLKSGIFHWRRNVAMLPNNDNDRLDLGVKLMVTAVAAMVALYSFCFSMLTETINLTGWGQLGDAMGSLNTLFTGLALAGLVYTSILQTRQASEQTKQLHLQRDQMSRQTREQLHTARLNVLSGVLQAQSTLSEVALSRPDSPARDREHTINTIKGLLIQVEILGWEARQGFGGGEWTPSVEKEATRAWLVRYLQRTAFDCAQLTTADKPLEIPYRIKAALEMIELLRELNHYKYPDAAHAVDSAVVVLKRYMLGQPGGSGVIHWCSIAEYHFPAGAPPWV